MIRTILIDDERHALNNLERLLKNYDDIEIMGTYTDVTEVFEKIGKDEIDLIFLDIEMPKMKGIEAAKKILAIDSNVQIVFVTAYDDYALDAFEVDVIDYVMKPIMKRRLDKTIERVKKYKNLPGKSQEECRILCFGNFEVLKGQQVVKWRTFKAKELAAYLVHHRGNFVHKSKIIEELWRDKEEEQATKLLHTTIYYVRNGLKPLNIDKAIIYSNEMYKFDMDTVFCDTLEFDQAFNNKVMDSNNIEILDKMIQLYRGEYLEENDYHWAVNEQARFSKMYMDLLLKIADFYMSKGKYSTSIPYLKAMLEKNPYIEDVHRKLLYAYASIKDDMSFKEHYKSMSNSFKGELNTGLSNITKELYKKYFAK